MRKANRINRFVYGWRLSVDYGQGWEEEVFETDHKSYIENKRLYQENCPYPQKWVRGREPNPEYKD